jgi:hypothetical protein
MVINTARVQAEEAVATIVAAMVKRSSGKAKFR